jgi:hypothetical protein
MQAGKTFTQEFQSTPHMGLYGFDRYILNPCYTVNVSILFEQESCQAINQERLSRL